MGAFLENLCEDVRQSVVGSRVAPRAAIDDTVMSFDRAISLRLIVNELVANAIKHAFRDGRRGQISVLLRSDQSSRLSLEFPDDGIGLPDCAAEGRGHAPVGALALQFGGAVEWHRAPGASARIVFPDVAQDA